MRGVAFFGLALTFASLAHVQALQTSLRASHSLSAPAELPCPEKKSPPYEWEEICCTSSKTNAGGGRATADRKPLLKCYNCKNWTPEGSDITYKMPDNKWYEYETDADAVCGFHGQKCKAPPANVLAAAQKGITVEALEREEADIESAKLDAELNEQKATSSLTFAVAEQATAEADLEKATEAREAATGDAIADADVALAAADIEVKKAKENTEDKSNSEEEAKTIVEDADAMAEKDAEEKRLSKIAFCPSFQVNKNMDPGKPTWTDADGTVLAAMPNGKKSDNAGEWTQEQKEWHMNAEITSPTKEELFEKVYVQGSNVFVVTSKDGYGNVNQCKMNVVVTDSEPPVIAPCPDSLNEETEAGVCYYTAEWEKPNPSDNVGTCAPIVTREPGIFSPGTDVISWSVEDTSYNSANCSFSVTVVDREAPSFICPASVLRHYPNGTASKCAVPEHIEYRCTATGGKNGDLWDNCQGVDASDVVCTTVMPHQFPLGMTDVSCGLTDTSGNTLSRSTVVEVIDVTPPHITCPDDRREELGEGPTTTITDLEDATGLDNSCEVTVTCETQNPGKDLEPGFHTIAWKAVDAANHQTDCSYTIEIADVTAPEWSHCPGENEDFQVNNQPGEDYRVVDWEMPTATDNAGDDQLTYGGDYQTLVDGLAYPLGITHIKYTVQDPSGNEAVCEFDVLVHDNEIPRFVPGDFVDKNCKSGADGVATGDICQGKKITVGSHDESTRANTDVKVEDITTAHSCCISGDVCQEHAESSAFKVCGPQVTVS